MVFEDESINMDYASYDKESRKLSLQPLALNERIF